MRIRRAEWIMAFFSDEQAKNVTETGHGSHPVTEEKEDLRKTITCANLKET